MKPLLRLATDRPLEASAEFKIGVGSAPYLADHGVQGMVVLPGSFFIEMALCVDRELSKTVPALVRNVTFHEPIVLSADDTTIHVEVKDRGDGRFEYTFSEAGVENRRAVTLEIDRNESIALDTGIDGFSIEAFQAQSHAVIDSGPFYKTLSDNGNQYGPRFQHVVSIWRAGDQSLGRLSLARQDEGIEPSDVQTILLDSVTQLLAPFVIEKRKTFLLRSIEKVEVANRHVADPLWGHATLLPQSGDDQSVLGNVRIFDQSGQPYLQLSGVALTVLDRVDAADEKAAANLVVAANFTAEPLGDSLAFWGDHFGGQIHTEFAPYNQIFQQLLDPGSRFRQNRDGVNVILLGLEEWAVSDRHALMDLDKERAERCFGDRPTCVLPNGHEIVHLNRYETDYLYKEIFEDRCYLRHGVRLEDGDTVVDIGANIGLFSLFVMSRCANPTIYAFEPAPVVFDLLKRNCAAYGPNAQAMNLGVSDQPKTATFTFYEGSSVFSGFRPDETEDRAAVQAVVRNVLHGESIADDSVEGYVSELTADRLRPSTHECQLTSVSEIIRANRIDKIGLLKIDAEKSEWDIINGIEEHDWPKIDQVVIEVHDSNPQAVARLESLLIERGYRCAVEQESLLEGAGFLNLYATRRPPVVDSHSEALKRNAREFATALRAFMSEATAPLVLCVCPRTPAARVDATLAAALDDVEAVLLSEARGMANVHAISSASLLQLYPVDNYYDPHTHHVAHIPYTLEGYAAIGSALARAIFNLKRAPFKVIVLDCDNTLWKGVCGEDGPLGVELTAPYRALQDFMLGQMNAGMLLCLCSKNNEKDALDVFDQRSEMLLKRHHFVSWRINWKSKSENIHSLASELNLGLDSFIFIDDNPVDCADVRINCPGVVALQLPRDAESFPLFLSHIWAFDHTGGTEEDRNRTRMYQEGSKRQQYLEQSFSLKDFVTGLQLRVEVSEATEAQLGRVSQQTLRTNQFNFSSIRRSEHEIRQFLTREHASGLVVRVVDRFGDYGLVGVVMYETAADRYKVDTLLLSCRVLGRGVEHALVAWVGQRAVEDDKRLVEFTYRPTGKNLPALEFLTAIGDQYRNEAGTSWTFPAEHLARVEYHPDDKAPSGHRVPAAVNAEDRTHGRALAFGAADRSERLQRIGESLYDVNRLVRAIEEYRLRNQPLHVAADVTPATTLETALATIWRKVLGRPHVGLNDNFFEAGGTSLRAVQVVARIKTELKLSLSVVSLFECPTVALLAAKLSATSRDAHGKTTTTAAALRGQQRRRHAVRRKAS